MEAFTDFSNMIGSGTLFGTTIALTGIMSLGMKILQILFTLFLCWVLIKCSSKLIKIIRKAREGACPPNMPNYSKSEYISC